MAHEQPIEAAGPRTITVSGAGEASRMPDIAVLQVGIVVLDNDPAPARRVVAGRVNALLDAVTALGVANTDIATGSVSVTTDRDGTWNGKRKGADRVRGYTVSATVAVTVRNLDLLGAVFDAAVVAGANQVTGPSWRLEQPDAVQDEALTAAFGDARRKAALLVAAADATLGPVRTISDYSEPRHYARSRVSLKMAMPPSPEPEPEMRFAAEEQTESASVTVVWDILVPNGR